MRLAIALVIGLTTGLAMAEQKVEWIAHRGESFIAPENTLASFNLGWKNNDDADETDVQLTKDGRAIICHDPDTKRTTGTKLLIRDSTFEQLRALDAGSWKDPKYAGEKLPTLEETLATIPEGKRFFVEIKSGMDVVPETVRLVKASGKKPEQIALISFWPDALAAAKKALPEHQAYLLASFKQDKQTKTWTATMQPPGKSAASIEELITIAKEKNFDGLDLQDKAPFDGEAVKQIKSAGLKAYVWTIDDPSQAKKYIDWAIDGITTNRAAWLREQCQQK